MYPALVWAWVGVAAGGWVAGQTAGSIGGRVVGNGGAGAPNAKVYLHSSRSTFRLETVANAAGVYRFDNVPVGQYEVCATAIGGGFVDSCVWNRMGNRVTVTAAARAATADIELQRAAKLRIQVSDGQSLLAGEATKGRPLRVHIWTDNFVAIPVFGSAVSGTVRNFEIDVPVATDVTVGLEGARVRLAVEGTAAEKSVLRTKADVAAGSVKTVAVSVLGLAP